MKACPDAIDTRAVARSARQISPGFRESNAYLATLSARRHEVREAVLRFTADTGRLPVTGNDIGRHVGRVVVGGVRPSEQLIGEHIPASVREYAALQTEPASG